MRTLPYLLLILIIISCGKPDTGKRSTEFIKSEIMQDSIFRNLLKVTDAIVSEGNLSDSLAFLILPVEASCPSCRKKTIDSILKYKDNLKERHYIIINASGGRKIINSYFEEQKAELPVMKAQLVMDSTNWAYRLDLCKDRPVIYYTYDRKVYKKVAAIPASVRDDLREFFSGHRN